MAGVVGVTLLVLFGLAQLGHSAVTRAKAQAAADMAALAGVYEGREGAVDLALRNGGAVVGYDDLDGGVVVRVRVGESEATARARWGWDPAVGVDDGCCGG